MREKLEAETTDPGSEHVARRSLRRKKARDGEETTFF